MKYEVVARYGATGIADSLETDDWAEVKAFAEKQLQNDLHVELRNTEIGESMTITPEEYDQSLEGDVIPSSPYFNEGEDISQKAQEILERAVEEHFSADYEKELYFDRGDIISAETFAEWYKEFCDEWENYNRGASEGVPRPDHESFEHFLYIKIWEEWNIADYAADTLETRLKEALTAEEYEIVEQYLEDEMMTLDEAMEQAGFDGFTFEVKDLMDSYQLTLILATDNERNYDMGTIADIYCNADVAYLNKRLQGMDASEQEQRTDNAVTYLVHQQGHDVSELMQAIYADKESDSQFIKTLAQECEGATHYMEQLHVLVAVDKDSLDVLDAIARQEDHSGIEVSQKAVVGLHDRNVGASSYMEVELEKPLTIPTSMIFAAPIETGRDEYSVGEYMESELGKVKAIGDAEVKTKETTKDIVDSVKEIAEPKKTKNKSVERD